MENEMEIGTVVHSVDKAAKLIELLLYAHTPLSLRELTEQSGYPKSTVHALLSTLRRHAMIDQHADGKYFLGVRLFECGCAVSANWDISNVARPYLEQLASATDATAFISLLDGENVISFDQCSPANGVQVMQGIGQRLSLHATSQGKLMLSLRSEDEVERLLRKTGLQVFTPHTITDVSVLKAELNKIRANGYAVEDGEYKIGLRSVAAPVYDHFGSARYAIGVVGLFRRVRSDEFSSAVEQVLMQASNLSNAIGYRR